MPPRIQGTRHTGTTPAPTMRINVAPKTPNASAPVGSGERFSALEGKLAEEPGVRNPEALAASIGRKRYGNQRMSQMAEAGRKKGGA